MRLELQKEAVWGLKVCVPPPSLDKQNQLNCFFLNYVLPLPIILKLFTPPKIKCLGVLDRRATFFSCSTDRLKDYKYCRVAAHHIHFYIRALGSTCICLI